MAAAMAELTRQNQELTREIERQRREGHVEEQAQSQEDRRGNAEFENQPRSTTSRRVPHLEKEMDQMRKVMDEMKENMRRTNPVEDLRHKRSSSSLLTIEQGENESLRSFITRFNREALTVDEVDDKPLLTAFHNGVNLDLFIHKLYEKEPQSMAELVHSAQNFMNAEDTIIAKKRKRAERMEANPTHHPDQGPRPKKGRTEDKKDRDRDARKAGPSARNQNYTPLNALLDQVLMQIKDDPSLKWPERMKGDPNKRNKNKYCRFHRDYGHDTDECYDLKQQIENLIRQGKLRHFVGRDYKDEKLKAKMEESSRPPLGEIRVIIGGMSTGQSSKVKKTYLKAVQNVQLSGRPPRTKEVDEPTISFTDEKAERIHHPHDDAIVITLLIADYRTRRVLVDNGSSADILYYPAF
ncbi:uncharacterized protein LOC136071272 [Quercus suber]|uniref:uncharacterized protein LOC136071272 n=1 Tax=Quercus suber TaxID=58331 RepID=UPI0032DFBD5B